MRDTEKECPDMEVGSEIENVGSHGHALASFLRNSLTNLIEQGGGERVKLQEQSIKQYRMVTDLQPVAEAED